jgi:hypothetical protein
MTYRTLQRQCFSNRALKVDPDVIREFYCRDDNSRATAGKKETKTYKKERRQLRYLQHNVGVLHAKFGAENPTLEVGKSTFYQNRPFFVLKPKLKDRAQCLCMKCCNIQVRHNLYCVYGAIFRINTS